MTKSPRYAYAAIIVSALLVAFGGWRLYVSAWGTPDQFLRPGSADLVAGTDQAIAKLETLRDKARPQTLEWQQAEDSLRQLRELRGRLAQTEVESARRTERSIGLICIVAAVALYGGGYRRLLPGR